MDGIYKPFHTSNAFTALSRQIMCPFRETPKHCASAQCCANPGKIPNIAPQRHDGFKPCLAPVTLNPKPCPAPVTLNPKPCPAPLMSHETSRSSHQAATLGTMPTRGGVLSWYRCLVCSGSLAYTAAQCSLAGPPRMSAILRYACLRYPHASPGFHLKFGHSIAAAPSTCSGKRSPCSASGAGIGWNSSFLPSFPHLQVGHIASKHS